MLHLQQKTKILQEYYGSITKILIEDNILMTFKKNVKKMSNNVIID